MALRCACAMRGLSGGECADASLIRADCVSQPSRAASNMLPSTFRDNAMPFAGAGGSSKCPMRPRSASSSSRLASRPRHGPHQPARPGHGQQPFPDPVWLTIGSFAESQRDLEKLCWSRTTLHAFLPRLNQLRRPGTEPPAQINFLPETELKPCPSLHAAPQQRERDAARNGRDFRDLREKLP